MSLDIGLSAMNPAAFANAVVVGCDYRVKRGEAGDVVATFSTIHGYFAKLTPARPDAFSGGREAFSLSLDQPELARQLVDHFAHDDSHVVGMLDTKGVQWGGKTPGARTTCTDFRALGLLGKDFEWADGVLVVVSRPAVGNGRVGVKAGAGGQPTID